MIRLRAWLLVAMLAAGLGCGRRAPAGLEAWLAQWEVARACLLPGPSPDGVTGAAIGELGGPDPTTCQPALLALIGPDPAGDDELTRAWVRARDQVAAVLRAQSAPDRGGLLDGLDREVQALRRAAGLPEIPRDRRDVPVLAAARTVMIGDQPLTTAMLPRAAVRHGSLVLGRDERGEAVTSFFVRDVNDVAMWTHPRGSVVGYPAGSWTVGATELAGLGAPLAATDIGASRQVVYENVDASTPTYGLATRAAGGWETTVPLPGLAVVAQDVRTGTIDVAKATATATQLLRIDATNNGPPERVTAPAKVKYARCVDGGRTWFEAPAGFYVFDGTHGFAVAANDVDTRAHTYFVGCRQDVGLVVRPHPDTLDRCDADGCRPVLTAGRHHGTAAFDAGGRWIYAATIAGIVGIWREGVAAPTFYRLREPGALLQITLLTSGSHLVIESTSGALGFVPVPAAAGP